MKILYKNKGYPFSSSTAKYWMYIQILAVFKRKRYAQSPSAQNGPSADARGPARIHQMIPQFTQSDDGSFLRCSNPDCRSDVLSMTAVTVRGADASDRKGVVVRIENGEAKVEDQSNSSGSDLVVELRCFICDHTFSLHLTQWRAHISASSSRATPILPKNEAQIQPQWPSV